MDRALANLSLDQPAPQHELIRNHVRQLIISGKLAPGERLPSTQQLGAVWGANVLTVQTALAPLAREGLLRRVNRVGTFVGDPKPKLKCVGVYGYAASNESPYLQALRGALKHTLTEASLETDIWLDPRPDAQRGEPWPPLVKAAERREFDALIVLVASLPMQRWLAKLPVATSFQTTGGVSNRVQYDMAQFAERGLRALAGQGCRSVGLIAPWHTDPLPAGGLAELHSGFFERFEEVRRELGLTIKNSWMRLASQPLVSREHTEEQFGYEEFHRLWRQAHRPDGLIVYDDVTARGVILALLKQSVRVPEELKLVLHQNESLELLCPMPALFLISSEREMAQALVRQVRQQFRGDESQPVRVAFRLATNITAQPQNEQTDNQRESVMKTQNRHHRSGTWVRRLIGGMAIGLAATVSAAAWASVFYSENFESSTIGATPAGWAVLDAQNGFVNITGSQTANANVWVQSAPSPQPFNGTKALNFYDNSSTVRPFGWITSIPASKLDYDVTFRFDFNLQPSGANNETYVEVSSSNQRGASVQFAANGTAVRVYEPWTYGLSSAITISPNTWYHATLAMSPVALGTGAMTLTITDATDTLVGSPVNWYYSVAQMSGLGFSMIKVTEESVGSGLLVSNFYDNFQLSQANPEPSTVMLLGLGGWLAWRRRKFRC